VRVPEGEEEEKYEVVRKCENPEGMNERTRDFGFQVGNFQCDAYLGGGGNTDCLCNDKQRGQSRDGRGETKPKCQKSE
jgi:hypothetical protein